MEASAVWAPPQTLPEKWKECRPPLPATPSLLVYRIYRQSEHRESARERDLMDRSPTLLSPGKIFLSQSVTLHRTLKNPDVWIDPSKTRINWGHCTQLLLEDLRCDLGFIHMFFDGCTSFHQWKVMFDGSLMEKPLLVYIFLSFLESICPQAFVCTEFNFLF